MTHTILFLAANPLDTQVISFEREIRQIKDAIQRARHRDQLTLITEIGVTPKDVRRALLDHNPTIVHFCGHGEQRGLIFADEANRTRLVGAEAITELLKLFSDNLECVLLNACDTDAQAQLLQPHIPCVIGMNQPVDDQAACVFAEAFYDALGAGQGFKPAFELGRNAIRTDLPELKDKDGTYEYEKPQFYARNAALSDAAALDSDRDVLDDALERLYSSPVIALLAQDHRVTPAALQDLESRLRSRFGDDNVYHLKPLGSRRASVTDYFTHLGKQFGLDDTDTDAKLEMALDDALRDRELCLLISRLETGDGGQADAFASVLRNLTADTDRLKIALCGGQKLAELTMQGDSSLLNNAHPVDWPDLGIGDVQKLSDALDDSAARNLLDLSGGHPRLLDDAVRLYQGDPDTDIPQTLSQSPCLYQAFGRFRRDDTQADAVRTLLAKDELGAAAPFLFDDTLRSVYWLNLLASRNGQLVWRCPAIQAAGKAVLA